MAWGDELYIFKFKTILKIYYIFDITFYTHN